MPKKKKTWPLLTSAEILTLTAVASLGEVNNVQIFDAIREVFPEANFPTIYTALVRMTWKEYLTSRTGDPQPTRGGRARKYYSLTSKGRDALEANQQVFKAAMSMQNASEQA